MDINFFQILLWALWHTVILCIVGIVSQWCKPISMTLVLQAILWSSRCQQHDFFEVDFSNCKAPFDPKWRKNAEILDEPIDS